MDALAGWELGAHTGPVDGAPATWPVYRKGSGHGVVMVHEIPGPTPSVIGFGDELVAAGYTVVMPHLFGTPGADFGPRTVARSLAQVCIRREFTKLATGVTAPVTDWLRSLAAELHAERGGPGVGAIGMCLTGGFALAMMLDDSVAAPVLCQPSVPFAVGRRRSADINLSPADRERVQERARGGCSVLGLRYASDRAVGTRFDTLDELLGDAFIRVDLEGRGHSTVTEQRQQVAVDRVLEFLAGRLHPAG